MLNLLYILILSILIDILWGELPAIIHPVVWMGKTIDRFSANLISIKSKLSGIVLTFIILGIFTIICYSLLFLVSFSVISFILVSAILLSTTFAIKGLYKTARQVQSVLDENVNQARELVSHLVSRDTRKLSKNELVSATVESLTENINDSVTAPLFYVLAAGILVTFLFSLFNLNTFLNLNIPLTTSNNTNWLFEVGNSLTTSWYSFILITLPILSGVLYRVVNTLDAMVGYDNMKYRMIGYFPAKLDDVLNFLPSRITGIMVVIAAATSGMNWRNSWITMKLDAQKTPSPNSGYPMAAAAGALNVQLKKPGIYVLGKPTDTLDSNLIGKAIFLTKITIILYLMFSFIFYLILYLLITSI